MKKSIWIMQSLFLGLFTAGNLDYQIVNAVDETTETMPIIETEILEFKEEELTISEVLNDLFADGFTAVAQAQQLDDPDPEITKYSIDNLIIETDLDLNQLGNQTGSITVYDKGNSNVNDSLKLVVQESEPIESLDKTVKHAFDVSVQIEDHQAPVITLVSDKVWLDYQEEIIPEEWFDSAIDNADGDIADFVFDGSAIDSSTPGEYMATYSVSDSSGNTAIKEMTVIVNEEELPVYYTPSYVSANTSGSIYDMIALINQTRANYGLSAFQLDTGALGAAAQQRAIEASSYIAHYRPNGTSYSTVLDEYGVYYKESSEILTCAGNTASAGLDWWMSSPAHRSYVLSSRFTTIGIGFYNGMWSALLIY